MILNTLLSIPVYENISIVTESVGMNVDLKYCIEIFCTQKGTDVENGSRIIIKTREKVKIANQLTCVCVSE